MSPLDAAVFALRYPEVIKPTERKVEHATGLGLRCKCFSMDLKQNEIPRTAF